MEWRLVRENLPRRPCGMRRGGDATIVLRLAEAGDLGQLRQLANRSRLLNLPAEPLALLARLRSSERVASGAYSNADLVSSSLTFVAEDMRAGRVVGAASINLRRGTVDRPCVYYRIDTEGINETSLTRVVDVDGPSELGGLIVDPEYRRHRERVGSQLSFLRFAYVKLFPELFRGRLTSGLLGRLTSDGRSPFWDAVGKPTGLSLEEAERLRYRGERFLVDSLPERVDVSALPDAARAAIGAIGESSGPALRLMQKRGMTRLDLVDPLDGGPYLGGEVADVCPVEARTFDVEARPADGHDCSGEALLVAVTEGRRLIATRVPASVLGDSTRLPRGVKDCLNLNDAREIHAFALQ